MLSDSKSKRTAIITLISFVIVVVVNVVANVLPINGVSTAEIANSYPNLFAPASFTFAIWGVVYVMVFGYTLYQFKLFSTLRYQIHDLLMSTSITLIFVNLINSAWVVTWHYNMIEVSCGLIVVLLLLLISINLRLRYQRFDGNSNFLIKATFNVYLGWVTIATVANIVILLVSLSWDGLGISEEIWTSIIIVVAALIIVASIFSYQSLTIGCVGLWAFTGLVYQHLSAEGFDSQYKLVLMSLYFAFAVIAVSMMKLSYKNKGRKRLN